MEYTMKTKHGILFGFAVLLVVAIFSLSSCGDGAGGGGGSGGNDADGGGDGGNPTFSLEKSGSNAVLVTLSEGKWENKWYYDEFSSADYAALFVLTSNSI
jgi:hypothetical protein